MLLVLIAWLAGSTFLLLVPIAGLSSGSIGMVVFFLVGSFFFLLFALTRAAIGAGSFESDIDLCTAELDLNKRQQSNSSNKVTAELDLPERVVYVAPDIWCRRLLHY